MEFEDEKEASDLFVKMAGSIEENLEVRLGFASDPLHLEFDPVFMATTFLHAALKDQLSARQTKAAREGLIKIHGVRNKLANQSFASEDSAPPAPAPQKRKPTSEFSSQRSISLPRPFQNQSFPSGQRLTQRSTCSFVPLS